MIANRYISNKKFDLECGDSLPGIKIKYHVSSLNRDNKKVIWICHALTANSNPQEWWDTLVGPNKFFDTDRYFIVCANIIGSCYGSSGPASFDYDNGAFICDNGKPLMLNFPIISIRDLVKAHELLRLHLGIQKIDLLIGGSNGGFQAIEWAIQNPDIIDNLCLIATNAVVSPWCTAFNESQRLAIKSDKTFMQQHDINGGKSGLAAARSIALLSYRSYSGYQVTQQEQDENFFMAKRASSYQDYQGEKLVNRFDAYSYYFLSLGVDTHNVGRNRGGVKRALQSIKSKTLCIAIDSDILFPVEEMRIIAQNVPSATLEIISSSYGHDGFLLEYKQISESIKKHIKI